MKKSIGFIVGLLSLVCMKSSAETFSILWDNTTADRAFIGINLLASSSNSSQPPKLTNFRVSSVPANTHQIEQFFYTRETGDPQFPVVDTVLVTLQGTDKYFCSGMIEGPTVLLGRGIAPALNVSIRQEGDTYACSFRGPISRSDR